MHTFRFSATAMLRRLDKDTRERLLFPATSDVSIFRKKSAIHAVMALP